MARPSLLKRWEPAQASRPASLLASPGHNFSSAKQSCIIAFHLLALSAAGLHVYPRSDKATSTCLQTVPHTHVIMNLNTRRE